MRAERPVCVRLLTGADYLAEGLGPLVCASLPPTLVSSRPNLGHFLPIAAERVNCVGEILAVVVAESAQDARDAAELVSYSIDECAPVVTIDDALKGGAERSCPVRRTSPSLLRLATERRWTAPLQRPRG